MKMTMPISATKNKMTINTYKILFVPAGCNKDSAINVQLVLSSMTVLAHFTCFSTGEVFFFPSYLIFSFYNKDNSSSTHAVLWQAALLKVAGTEPSP